MIRENGLISIYFSVPPLLQRIQVPCNGMYTLHGFAAKVIRKNGFISIYFSRTPLDQKIQVPCHWMYTLRGGPFHDVVKKNSAHPLPVSWDVHVIRVP